MSLSNLSLEVLNSVISTANEGDCELISQSIKKRRKEINRKLRYVLIDIDVDYTWRKPYKPDILFDSLCSENELPEKIHSSLDKYIESYDNDYCHFLYNVCMHPSFVHVRGFQSNSLRDMLLTGLFQEEDGEEKNRKTSISKIYFKTFGINLFTEINDSVGIMNLFNNFEYGCGVWCLMKYSKTLEKLINNGLPWI